MPLTISVVKRPAMPAGKAVIADVTFDSSYDAGGESLTASDLGLLNIEYLEAHQKGVGNRICQYDYANSKLRLYTALGTEATTGSNQSAITVRIFAIGDSVGPAF
jgi:hypothetical protein